MILRKIQKKYKRKKQGVIFSLDAILAIIAAITLISASFFSLSQIHVIKWSQPNYFLTAIDTLAILRIDNTLQEALALNNPSKIQLFFDNMLEQQFCSSLTIYQKDDLINPVMTINKTGCTKGEQVYVFKNTLFANNDYYLMVMRIWYQ